MVFSGLVSFDLEEGVGGLRELREIKLLDTGQTVSAGALAYCLRLSNLFGLCVVHAVLYMYLD